MAARNHGFWADIPAGFAMRYSAPTARGFSRAHPTRPLASGTQTGSARRRTYRSRGPPSVQTGHSSSGGAAARSRFGGAMARRCRTQWPLKAVTPRVFPMRPSASTDTPSSSLRERLRTCGDSKTPRPRKSSGATNKSLTSATFSPDGTLVLTASDDGTARLWDVVGQREPVVLRGHAGRVFSAVFSSDGTRVLTASEDATARVWHVSAREAPLILRGHEGYVMSAAFSSDGARVITTGADRTARIWDVSAPADGLARDVSGTQPSLCECRSWRPVHRHGPHGWHGAPVADRRQRRHTRDCAGTKIRVNTVAFSQDGQRVVTAGSDTTAQIWRVDGSGVPVVLNGHGHGL